METGKVGVCGEEVVWVTFEHSFRVVFLFEMSVSYVQRFLFSPRIVRFQLDLTMKNEICRVRSKSERARAMDVTLQSLRFTRYYLEPVSLSARNVLTMPEQSPIIAVVMSTGFGFGG